MLFRSGLGEREALVLGLEPELLDRMAAGAERRPLLTGHAAVLGAVPGVAREAHAHGDRGVGLALRDALEHRRRGDAAPPSSELKDNPEQSRTTILRKAEFTYWTELLKTHKGSIKTICEQTNLSPSRVYQILEKLKLKPKLYR